MQCLAVASLILLTITPSPAQTPRAVVQNHSFIDRSGSPILEFTITVHTPAAKVWTALTDSEEYRKWAAPAAFIDLRPGGIFEVGYAPGARAGDSANVRHEITAYLPTRMIALHNLHAPIGPAAEPYKKLQIIILLTDCGGGNAEVSLANVGFQKGVGFDGLYAFLAQHNPEYLEQLAAYVGSNKD